MFNDPRINNPECSECKKAMSPQELNNLIKGIREQRGRDDRLAYLGMGILVIGGCLLLASCPPIPPGDPDVLDSQIYNNPKGQGLNPIRIDELNNKIKSKLSKLKLAIKEQLKEIKK